MKKVFFVLFVAVLFTPSMVLAQASKTGQEFVMLDGKTLAFEREIAKEKAIKSYDAQKELKEILSHQKTIIMRMIQKGMSSQTDREYAKNEINRLVREIAHPEPDMHISRTSSNTAMARQVVIEKKVLE